MSADDARKLFVGGLSDAIGEMELRTLLEAAQFSVEHVAVPRDRETGKVRGFGFVTLSGAEEVPRAIAQLNGAVLMGRNLSIRPFSQEPPKRGPMERVPRGQEPSLFLGKLPYEATEAEIVALFEAQGAGPVIRVSLPLGPDGRPRGFGFATMGSEEAANLAIEKLDGATLRGRPIVVSKAQPKGPGGGPGGGGFPGGPRPMGMGGGPTREPRADGFRDAPREARPEARGRREEGDRFPGGGFPGGGESFPPPPPDDGRGGGRRRDARKPEKKPEKKRGASGREGGRGPRGGGGNWHRWEEDD